MKIHIDQTYLSIEQFSKIKIRNVSTNQILAKSNEISYLLWVMLVLNHIFVVRILSSSKSRNTPQDCSNSSPTGEADSINNKCGEEKQAKGGHISHFLPTSRRIVQFSNGKVPQIVLFIYSLWSFMLDMGMFTFFLLNSMWTFWNYFEEQINYTTTASLEDLLLNECFKAI